MKEELIDDLQEDNKEEFALQLKLLFSITLLASVIMILFVFDKLIETINSPIDQIEKNFEYTMISVFTLLCIMRILGGVLMLKRKKLGFYFHALANTLFGTGIIVSLIGIMDEFENVFEMMEEDFIIFLPMILFSLSCFLFIYLYYRQTIHFQK